MYRAASQDANIGYALLYWLIFGFIAGVANAMWNAALGGAMASLMEPFYGQMPELEDLMLMQPAGGLLLNLVLLPVWMGIGLVIWFIWTGVVHLLLMLFGGANQGYEATFRTMSYANGSVAIFYVFPICGMYVAIVWSLVAQIIGLREIHETSGGKAAAAVLGPLVLCLACLCLGIMLFVFGIGLASASG